MRQLSNASEIAMEITESQMENIKKANAGYEDQAIALKSEITGLKNCKSAECLQLIVSGLIAEGST